MSSLKDEVKEIVEIVALVPDEHKAMCFEMLLKEAIASRRAPPSPSPPPPPAPTAAPKAPSNGAPQESEVSSPAPGAQPKVTEGEDIVMGDLHMKARKFMEKGEVTLDHLNELFYKTSEGFASLSVDLKVTKMSEAQIRIALLQAFHNSLSTGDFQTTIEAVREECKMRKTYDLPNFTANLKSAADFFDFGTWSKEITELRLSEAGKKELAALIKLVS